MENVEDCLIQCGQAIQRQRNNRSRKARRRLKFLGLCKQDIMVNASHTGTERSKCFCLAFGTFSFNNSEFIHGAISVRL